MNFSIMMACLGFAVELYQLAQQSSDEGSVAIEKQLKRYKKLIREARIVGDYKKIERAFEDMELPPPSS